MISPLERLRLNYQPKLPQILHYISHLTLQPGTSKELKPELKNLFPKTAHQTIVHFVAGNEQEHDHLKVGVVLSGGQAAGGHNVICGLFDALHKLNAGSKLYGFLNGPSGIIDNKYQELTTEIIDAYRNLGGFDMIGSGRTKIETPEQFQAAEKTVAALELDGLVVIGGDDSNTNAALLAEYFIAHNIKTRVVGVPKTIDGDLKNESVAISFGFDSACKTYSELIGNTARDAMSARKYYFFVKLMGRSASHIALECALQTQPNLTLIGEEIEAKKSTLKEITKTIADLVVARYEQKKEFGVILLPEGLIEFIPECKVLINELNGLLAGDNEPSKVVEKLSPASAACFWELPKEIQSQLLLDRDPHGNVQVSKIETERLFIETVARELKARGFKGKFAAQPLFFGYEGRSCLPSNFDAQYCYALGYVAALLVDRGATGHMAVVTQLTQPVEKWGIEGVPLVHMMDLETRKGKVKPVIKKALVDLKGPIFGTFNAKRDQWKIVDNYRYPGPIQFFGPAEIADLVVFTLKNDWV